ncbi:MAG: tRNA1(Val) (adenine(37)-N6)-methyltransferase [bacterium]
MSLNLCQSSNGYRYSIDSFLLADFCTSPKSSRILDLGSGCGIISILLSMSFPQSKITGIEIQSELIMLANQNILNNRLKEKICFIHGDIREILKYFINEEFEVVVTNPPYYRIGDGRINPHFGKASSRHEIIGSLRDFIGAAEKVLRPKGSFYIIYTAKRATELIYECIKFGLEPKIIRNVHSKRDSDANLILLKAIKMGRIGLKILPPVYLFKKNGKYTNEAERILKKWRFLSAKTNLH